MDFTPDSQAASFIDHQVSLESDRITAAGARAIPLPVKNFGILLDSDPSDPDFPLQKDPIKTQSRKQAKMGLDVCNRVEVGTGMDMAKIAQIMISPPIEYPGRAGWKYVHVLCFTAASNTMALLIPYLYAPFMVIKDAEGGVKGEEDEKEVVTALTEEEAKEMGGVVVKNTLREWLFVNEKQERARHKVEEFHDV
ncbi:hypothetical protein YB2330_002723 [Saitoella coloradoensis]